MVLKTLKGANSIPTNRNR